MTFDIEANRRAVKWTFREKVGRALWGMVNPLFRWSPRPCHCWRNFLLRLFGAKVGKSVQIDPTAKIFIPWNLKIGNWSSVGFEALLYNLGPLTIGEKVTISQRAHLCGGSHDYRSSAMDLIKAPIGIGDGVWICADAFVGPGVKVGRGAVVGARAVVVKDVGEGAVVAGNPAAPVGKR